MYSYIYGGNPLSCAVGLAVLNCIKDHDLVTRSKQMGDNLLGASDTRQSQASAAVTTSNLLFGKGFVRIAYTSPRYSDLYAR